MDNNNKDLQTITESNNGGDLSTNDVETSYYQYDDVESTCSTPYVSAPSSPGRAGAGGGFFYSAPASPMHFVLSSSLSKSTPPPLESSGSFEFDFSSRTGKSGPAATGSMSSADELFLNGQIRPMKLSSHLQRPQVLAPLLDLDENELEDDADVFPRGRDVKWRDRSLRRRTRSMSPLRTTSFQCYESDDEDQNDKDEKSDKDGAIGTIEGLGCKVNEAASTETTPSMSASSSRSSSVSRNSKRWVFIKEFLYRSKSEGRNNSHKFWTNISFSPVKDKKFPVAKSAKTETDGINVDAKKAKASAKKLPAGTGKPSNGVGKRRVPTSPHELHYKAHRAQAEEMRKKTFLPYRQGLLGCLGFSSKSYGAMNGFARALNPVSSR